MLFGVNQFVQAAAVTALTRELPELGAMQQAFRKRRDCLCARASTDSGPQNLARQQNLWVDLG